jgi:molecular chaperone DnaJ
LMCRVVVETPVSLTVKQKEILREFEKTLHNTAHTPKENSWLDSVKSFFEGISK